MEVSYFKLFVFNLDFYYLKVILLFAFILVLNSFSKNNSDPGILDSDSKGGLKQDPYIGIFRWFVVSYGLLFFVSWIFDIGLIRSDYFIRGPFFYNVFYSIMIISRFVFPILLFFKWFYKRVGLLFLFSILINIGWIFERLILLITAYHRG